MGPEALIRPRLSRWMSPSRFAPVGARVPLALKAVRKGGRVVCAGIHMSPIPGLTYDLLWGGRE